MRIAAFKLKIAFGPGEKECSLSMQAVEALEIQIGTVHNVKGTRLGDKQVQDIDIMEPPIRNMNKFGNASPKIHQGMEFESAFGLAETRPGKQTHTEIYGCGVQSIRC